VIGRETRAAVLLAASSHGSIFGSGQAWMPNDIDGLRLSMESQFYFARRESGIIERVSRQIYANALQRPFPLRIWFRRSQTST